jgi:hypothetical protein
MVLFEIHILDSRIYDFLTLLPYNQTMGIFRQFSSEKWLLLSYAGAVEGFENNSRIESSTHAPLRLVVSM